MPGSTPALTLRWFDAGDIPMMMGWIQARRNAAWFTEPGYDEDLRDHLSEDRIGHHRQRPRPPLSPHVRRADSAMATETCMTPTTGASCDVNQTEPHRTNL